jgi:hypothetical protein
MVVNSVNLKILNLNVLRLTIIDIYLSHHLSYLGNLATIIIKSKRCSSVTKVALHLSIISVETFIIQSSVLAPTTLLWS